MIEIVYAKDFPKVAKCLPKSARKKFADNVMLLQADPFHPKLHSKRLSGNLVEMFSFRITRDWRVIFRFVDKSTIELLDVGHRKDIYR